MSWAQDSTEGSDLRSRLQKAVRSTGAARRNTSASLAAARAPLSYSAKRYLMTVVVPVQGRMLQHASAWPGLAAIQLELLHRMQRQMRSLRGI